MLVCRNSECEGKAAYPSRAEGSDTVSLGAGRSRLPFHAPCESGRIISSRRAEQLVLYICEQCVFTCVCTNLCIMEKRPPVNTLRLLFIKIERTAATSPVVSFEMHKVYGNKQIHIRSEDERRGQSPSYVPRVATWFIRPRAGYKPRRNQASEH